jgi:hypothetical protein
MIKLIVDNGPIERTRIRQLGLRVLTGDPQLQAAREHHVSELQAAIEAFQAAHNRREDDAREIAMQLAAMYAEVLKR